MSIFIFPCLTTYAKQNTTETGMYHIPCPHSMISELLHFLSWGLYDYLNFGMEQNKTKNKWKRKTKFPIIVMHAVVVPLLNCIMASKIGSVFQWEKIIFKDLPCLSFCPNFNLYLLKLFIHFLYCSFCPHVPHRAEYYYIFPVTIFFNLSYKSFDDV